MGEGILYLLTSFWLGAVHAATPGHGKTIAASYIVGVRGRPVDAVVLGIFVPLSHTSGIILVAVLATLGSTWLIPQRVEAYLAVHRDPRHRDWLLDAANPDAPPAGTCGGSSARPLARPGPALSQPRMGCDSLARHRRDLASSAEARHPARPGYRGRTAAGPGGLGHSAGGNCRWETRSRAIDRACL